MPFWSREKDYGNKYFHEYPTTLFNFSHEGVQVKGEKYFKLFSSKKSNVSNGKMPYVDVNAHREYKKLSIYLFYSIIVLST